MNSTLLFSLTNLSKQNSDNKHHSKIELMVCQAGGHNCKKHLIAINEYYLVANNYHYEKDYLNTIESLKCAFFKTKELNEESCLNCANLFRSTIRQSLENIHGELHNLTTGLIKNKRYLTCYKKSCTVLDDLK